LTLSKEYEKEHGPIPLFKVSKQLTDLTLLFLVSAITYFLSRITSDNNAGYSIKRTMLEMSNSLWVFSILR